jgi:hypothetical protein
MKLPPGIAAVLLTLLLVSGLSIVWRLASSGQTSSIPGLAFWIISVYAGIWYYRRRSRGTRSD